jgi:hypothetical protein
LSLNKNGLKPNQDNAKKILKISEKLLASEDKSLTNTAREVKLLSSLASNFSEILRIFLALS